MKNSFVKISKPCSEKWEIMQPNENGNFCDLCSKTVIDFTQLNQQQITAKMKQANGNICARITQTQINKPLLNFEAQKQYDLPFSKVAASVMIASSLLATQPSQGENNKSDNPIEQTASIDLKINTDYLKSKPAPSKPIDFTLLRGQIISEKEEIPIKNAKITFVTTQKLITVYSQEDGTFSIEIPTELMDDENVIRVSYSKVNDEKLMINGFDFKQDDLILTKEDISSIYLIKAKPQVHYLGGISSYSEDEKIPIVVDSGVSIKYKDFIKAQENKKSSCSLENKEYLYFESKIAIAIYGKKAKNGLYILTEKQK